MYKVERARGRGGVTVDGVMEGNKRCISSVNGCDRRGGRPAERGERTKGHRESVRSTHRTNKRGMRRTICKVISQYE